MTSKNTHPKGTPEPPKPITTPGTPVYVVRLSLVPTTMGLGGVPLQPTAPQHHVQALVSQSGWKDPMTVGRLLSELAGEMCNQMGNVPQKANTGPSARLGLPSQNTSTAPGETPLLASSDVVDPKIEE